MERSTKNFRIRKARRWLQMYLPASCQSLHDVEKYGVIYGGVQKNIGPAGVVIAIIREDLIRDDVLPGTPTMLKYKTQADERFSL